MFIFSSKHHLDWATADQTSEAYSTSYLLKIVNWKARILEYCKFFLISTTLFGGDSAVINLEAEEQVHLLGFKHSCIVYYRIRSSNQHLAQYQNKRAPTNSTWPSNTTKLQPMWHRNSTWQGISEVTASIVVTPGLGVRMANVLQLFGIRMYGVVQKHPR
jgi:hypothetical protein